MASPNPAVTADKVFAYADRYARRHEAAGRGTQCPTLRQAAKRFRCSYDDLELAVADYMGDGYLGIAVAVGIPGVGTADIEPRGEWQIEAYE